MQIKNWTMFSKLFSYKTSGAIFLYVRSMRIWTEYEYIIIIIISALVYKDGQWIYKIIDVISVSKFVSLINYIMFIRNVIVIK